VRGEDDREKGQATQSHFLKELIQRQQSRIDTQRVVPRVPQLRSFAPAASENSRRKIRSPKASFPKKGGPPTRRDRPEDEDQLGKPINSN
jgi:hypothetical protein